MLFEQFIRQYIQDLIDFSDIKYDIQKNDIEDIIYDITNNDNLWMILDNYITEKLDRYAIEEEEL